MGIAIGGVGSSSQALDAPEDWPYLEQDVLLKTRSRKVLHFRLITSSRWSQWLEVTLGELMPSGDPPLLKRRKQLTREQAIQLWDQRRQDGWMPCPPQWQPPARRSRH